jgi:drug/metabolite transporter (DMT)-like permease
MNKQSFFLSLLLTFISFIWAGSFIVVRHVVVDIPPVHLGFLRFLVATPLMFVALRIRGNYRLPSKKLFPSLGALGITGVTLLYIFQYFGVEYTNASTSAVLINTNVIFIALLSLIILKERFNLRKSIGIVLSFIGVVLIVFAQLLNETIHFNAQFFLGVILIILSALSWAVYSILGKQLLGRYDEITVTAYAFLFGTLFYVPFALPGLSETVMHLSITDWMEVGYLAVACSLFAYVAWYYALKHTETSKAAVFLNFIPFFAIILSIFSGESITFFFLGGAILIIYGVYLTQRG